MSDTPESTEAPQTMGGRVLRFVTALPPKLTTEGAKQRLRDGFERSQAFWDEYARLEAQGLTHVRTLVVESSKMAAETVNYSLTLGVEARKLSLEAMRRAFELFVPTR